MRILVVSDTHGNISSVIKVIEKLQGIEYIFHLGDHASDADKISNLYPNIKMYSVTGNCDFSPKKSSELLITLGGVNFYLTHGHMYNVKRSLLSISMKGRSLNADFVVFGHTHTPLIEKDGDLTLLNPGSCKGAFLQNYGIIEIENGVAKACIL